MAKFAYYRGTHYASSEVAIGDIVGARVVYQCRVYRPDTGLVVCWAQADTLQEAVVRAGMIAGVLDLAEATRFGQADELAKSLDGASDPNPCTIFP